MAAVAPSALYSNHSATQIIAPHPRKTLSSVLANSSMPRLGISSPGPRVLKHMVGTSNAMHTPHYNQEDGGQQQHEQQLQRQPLHPLLQSAHMARNLGLHGHPAFNLCTVQEDYEMTLDEESGFETEEDTDAYFELLEIIGTSAASSVSSFTSVSSPSSQQTAMPPSARRRKSSVPALFPLAAGPEESPMADALPAQCFDNFEPPKLSKTPFRPQVQQIKIGSQNGKSTGDVHFVISSPVSRTRNPVPLNTPFLGYSTHRTDNPDVASLAYHNDSDSDGGESDSDAAIIGILSPSPQPLMDSPPPMMRDGTHLSPADNWHIIGLPAAGVRARRMRSKSLSAVDRPTQYVF